MPETIFAFLTNQFSYQHRLPCFSCYLCFSLDMCLQSAVCLVHCDIAGSLSWVSLPGEGRPWLSSHSQTWCSFLDNIRTVSGYKNLSRPWYNLQRSRAKYFYKLFSPPHMIPQPYLEWSDWKNQLCMSCNVVAGRKWGGGGSYWLKLWLVQPTTHHQLQTNMGVFSFVCMISRRVQV